MAATVYQLKVTLRGVRPPIWRRLRVPGALTLGRLHHALQIALGWTDSHLHQFLVGDDLYGVPDPADDLGVKVLDERRVRLEQIATRARSRFVYEYDFGDGWEHDVVVEGIEQIAAPDWFVMCLDGRRACPPEDCGGPLGYADLIECLADPNHPEHEEMKEWAGPDVAPEDFDLKRVNSELRSATARWRPRTPKARRAKVVPSTKPAND
jgi:hypothetical protein